MTTFDTVKNYIKNKIGKEVNMDTNLRELGIDSLDLLEFVVDLEKSLGVKIPDSELLKINSVKDIVNAIDSTSK